MLKSIAVGLFVASAASFAAMPTAHALAYGTSNVTVEIAPGLTAQRFARTCGFWQVYGAGCVAWQTTGFTVPTDILDRATVVTVARGGRIVIAYQGGIAYSDDRGANWNAARFEGAQTALSVAFDARSDFGVAVGSNGNLWTTDDRGTTWRARRDAAGQTLVDVVVLGRTIAFSDDRGGAWVSVDGGTSVRTLADSANGMHPAMPRMTVHEHAIWVLVGGTVWWRADASGNVERIDHPPPRS